MVVDRPRYRRSCDRRGQESDGVCREDLHVWASSCVDAPLEDVVSMMPGLLTRITLELFLKSASLFEFLLIP
jgi:hypothetical protein